MWYYNWFLALKDFNWISKTTHPLYHCLHLNLCLLLSMNLLLNLHLLNVLHIFLSTGPHYSYWRDYFHLIHPLPCSLKLDQKYDLFQQLYSQYCDVHLLMISHNPYNKHTTKGNHSKPSFSSSFWVHSLQDCIKDSPNQNGCGWGLKKKPNSLFPLREISAAGVQR